MKTIIYSKENPVSVKKVKDWKSRHPKFIFLELGEDKAVKEALADGSIRTVELDKAKAKKKAVKSTVDPVAINIDFSSDKPATAKNLRTGETTTLKKGAPKKPKAEKEPKVKKKK